MGVSVSLHKPVLVEEVLHYLRVRPGGVYVDCTLGTGGHTLAILGVPDTRVYAIDIDEESIAVARKRIREMGVNGSRIEIIKNNFRNIRSLIPEKVDGILFDLGLSSYQIDNPLRGFSYRFDAPLDMRFDRESGTPFYKILPHLGYEGLSRIIETYGEERMARRIARAIVGKSIKTTFELRDLILSHVRTRRPDRILARVFQAFRIYLNHELDNLEIALNGAVDSLKLGGRICVISYHSLEDGIVKHFFRRTNELQIITKKVVRPSEEEIADNPRARSARLRCAEKITNHNSQFTSR